MIKILELLAQKGSINSKEIPAIEEEISSGGVGVEEVLLRRGISSDDILQAKSEYYKIPFKTIGEEGVSYDTLRYIPEESAIHYQLVPLVLRDGVLEIGVLDPDNIEALDALNFISSKIGFPYKVFIISESDFKKVIEKYKGITSEVGKALSELEGDLAPEDLEVQLEEIKVKDSDEDVERIKEDAPVTKMVATIIRYAVEGKASDIHIEPTLTNVRVRFRVDGDLYTSLTLPLPVQRAVVARIKILSSIKLDEKRKPQDGRFSATVDNRRIDFRVSTFPISYGEKVVLRILDRERGTIRLEDLGYSKEQLEKTRTMISRPYGIILLSGPTGSGKSTSLYAMLNEVDREKRNVVSLEDPVEYEIQGVNQSQVRPEIGYTFASGLRSILRQDPNIIMVGEIRDKETAQLAVQAALTGHLVLSTIHTNTAVGAIPRLIDMGIDPFLIAPTLIGVIAQRLVRVICPGSGKKMPIEGSIKLMIENQFADLPAKYHAALPMGKSVMGVDPSPECPSGTRGRTGVFEILTMDRDLEEVILKRPVEEDVWKAARNKGMITMKEDAIFKAMKGEIPFEEINTLGGALLVDEEA